jgi:hypothetical protein
MLAPALRTRLASLQVGFVVCANCTNDQSRRQLTTVITNPTQNMDMICSFFLGDMLSLASMGSGSVRMAKSRKISIPPRANPKLFTLFSRYSRKMRVNTHRRTSTPQKPAISPLQPSQKKETGVHWKIMENTLAMPKHVTTPIKTQTTVRNRGSIMMRR